MRFVFAVNGWHLGGIVTFCRNLSAGLRDRQHEVTLLVIHHAGAHHPVPEGLFDHCVVLPRGVSRTVPFVRKVAQTIDRLNPDFLVLNASPYAMAALPYIHRAIIRTPVVHVPDEADLAFTNTLWWDRVLTVSDFVAETLRKREGCERVTVCPLGIPMPSPTRETPKRMEGPLQIVSASRIVIPQKRMDRLPVIAKMMTERRVDFYWTVLGDGTYLRELRQEINRSGLNNRFDFTGSVSPSEVASRFRKADVFVMVSDYEGLPQALLEAMAHGVVPVVSRITGSTTCVVKDRTSGYLCEPSDSLEFAEAIVELANNPSLRMDMGLRAAETIARDFNLDSLTGRFLAIADELRSGDISRADPLSLADAGSPGRLLQCLGFWRCLRNHTLGQMKRWIWRRTRAAASLVGEGLPPSI